MLSSTDSAAAACHLEMLFDWEVSGDCGRKGYYPAVGLVPHWEASCCHRVAYAAYEEMVQVDSWEVEVARVRHH